MKRNCPGCGMSTIPVVELQPRPVPEHGKVLFVATLDPGDGLPEDIQAAVAAFAEQVAPGRNDWVVLQPGDSLAMLSDDQLADAGLQRLHQR